MGAYHTLYLKNRRKTIFVQQWVNIYQDFCIYKITDIQS